jgi:hypothetical protein
MSYFRTRRAVSVPLPAPGFPKRIMRSTLPLGWFESAPESASGAAAERELRRRNGRAIWERDDVENARRHMLRCAMSWGEIIVWDEPGKLAYAVCAPTHITRQLINDKHD